MSIQLPFHLHIQESVPLEAKKLVHQLMGHHGQELANVLITDLACLPVYMSDEVTVVLHEMMLFTKQVKP